MRGSSVVNERRDLASSGAEAMLIDDVLPVFDATIADHAVVDAPPQTVYLAARELDFMQVHSPVVDTVMTLRDLPARIGRRFGRETDPAPQATMRLADLLDGTIESDDLDAWLALGDAPGRELVFGAIGKVWQPDIDWRPVAADAFRDFDEPGYAKIAAGFSIRAYGTDRTLLSYEARTATTDEAARRSFLRYWRLVHRVVGVVMRAAVRTVKEAAEAERSADPTPG